MRVKLCSELELSSAEKWGDDGGVRCVMPASGTEGLCWLRAVVATLFDSFLLSRRVPVSLSPCLSLYLSFCLFYFSFCPSPFLHL